MVPSNSRVALLLLFCCTIPASTALAQDNSTQDAIEKLETSVLEAMKEGAFDQIPKLRKSIFNLKVEQRRQLQFSLGPKEFEWSFAGEYPAFTDDALGLEYVIGSEIKNYESLLVVHGKQLERMQRFNVAFDKMRELHPKTVVNVQLSWMEDERIRSVSIFEIFAQQEIKEVNRFLKWLNSTDDGLGAFNLDGDIAALPKKKQPAKITISLRLPEKSAKRR